MAKGMKRAWREKERKSRRKKFLEEATKEPNGGRKHRRKKFLEEATKEHKKAAGTYKRGRRPGQKTGAKAGDLSKAELYKKAKEIKKRDSHNEPISTYDKKQLQKYILKNE
tara:strand:- start:2689 stop:3021 length:333 start_codon:yes stop_codon:yes gene_type:complete